MPAFSYEAVDAAGASKKGVVNADSPRAARSDLRAQGLVPITVVTIEAQLDSKQERPNAAHSATTFPRSNWRCSPANLQACSKLACRLNRRFLHCWSRPNALMCAI